jgi:hypothetical protein
MAVRKAREDVPANPLDRSLIINIFRILFLFESDLPVVALLDAKKNGVNTPRISKCKRIEARKGSQHGNLRRLNDQPAPVWKLSQAW